MGSSWGPLGAAPAAAQDVACPAGNLIAGSSPTARPGVTLGKRLTDGIMAGEGDPWQSELTSVLADTKAHAVYDLGATTRVTAVDLQGDNNDDYIVELSDDGRTFTSLWVADPVSGQGMRRRGTCSLEGSGRYLRVRAEGGDGFYSLSEVQVFCAAPSEWPPPIKVENTAQWWWQKILEKRDHRYRLGIALLGLLFFIALFRVEERKKALLVASALSVTMLGVAGYRLYGARLAPWFASWGVYVLGALVVAWAARGFWLAKHKQELRQWLERGALVWVILACATAWVNFGVFHSSRIVHFWDTFHYYVGSKYFEENEYERLYECVIAVDYEDRGDKDIEKRKIRDLTDNRLHFVTKDEVLRYQENCAAHFTPERWEAFREDARSFRTVMGSSWWKDMLMDHGYNASPISNMVAAFLTNIGWQDQVPKISSAGTAPSDLAGFRKRVLRYTLIDLALYGGAFLMILWAFGLRSCALAALVWGTGYPWAYFWTGGSFARVPWFFMAVAALCLLKRGFPLLSGFVLSWSALLRLFPAVLAGGPIAAVVDRFIHRKKVDRPWLDASDKRFIAGGALGVLVLCSASIGINGVDAHSQFLGNTFKHAETPLTNHMGLPTVLSYKPSQVGRFTKDSSLDDPWANWKQARKETKHDRRWLHGLILLGMFMLLALAGRRLAPWAVLAASTILIVGFFELTCYYYSFVVLMAPLAIERLRYSVALILVGIGGLILQFFIGWY
ncbi:MAG: discoidin domain-containing protein, partial [Myxococcales bacterium]